jgi:hypothetical protein
MRDHERHLSGRVHTSEDVARPAKTQQPGDEGEPDIRRPPDSDVPEFNSDDPQAPNSPCAPPFTGEDVEDVGRPRKRDTPPVM